MQQIEVFTQKTGFWVPTRIALPSSGFTLLGESEQSSLNGLLFDALSAFPPPIKGPNPNGFGPFFCSIGQGKLE